MRAAEREAGASSAAAERNSGHGRWREREVERFWIDREMTSLPEMGMVV